MGRTFILFLCFVLNFTYLYSSGSWNLVKDSENIKVYIKDSKDNSEYVNLKAVTHAKGSIASFASLMHDVENYNRWMHAVKETFIVAQQDEFQFTYYMLTDFPWPANDRDAVINMRFEWNPETKTFVTISKDVEGLVPVKEDIVRVEEVKASYTFIQKSQDQIKIVYKGKIKPGIKLPDWLMEKVYHIAPFNTLKNIKEVVLKPEYWNSDFDMDKI